MALTKQRWYHVGLHFECLQCGRCCSGPNEGYVWVTRPEVEQIARFLKLTVQQFRQTYTRRVGLRTTILEHPRTKDCIFLQTSETGKRCRIYPVRPSQCRSWPFWTSNLVNADTWNQTGQRCPGINRGKYYSFDQIEQIRKNKNWWDKTKESRISAAR